MHELMPVQLVACFLVLVSELAVDRRMVINRGINHAR